MTTNDELSEIKDVLARLERATTKMLTNGGNYAPLSVKLLDERACVDVLKEARQVLTKETP